MAVHSSIMHFPIVANEFERSYALLFLENVVLCAESTRINTLQETAKEQGFQ